MNSLNRRLFFIFVTATGLIWLAATCWVYIGTTREVENVLDSRLQEAARMVLSLVSGNGAGSFQKDVDASHPGDPLSYERQLSCQIWSLDGRLVARSSGAPSEKLTDTRTGFSDASSTARLGASLRPRIPERTCVFWSVTGWAYGKPS